MNTYCTLDDVLEPRGVIVPSVLEQNLYLAQIDTVSRNIDSICGRHFYVIEGVAKKFPGVPNDDLVIDDLLTLDEWATDSSCDNAYSETWTEDTDFEMHPTFQFPRMWAKRLCGTSMQWDGHSTLHRLTGDWGAGDLIREFPWDATTITGTVADTSATTVTVNAEGTIGAGHTIRIGSEQMYVIAVTDDDSDEITVIRAVNNTDGAIHSGAAISIAAYPGAVKTACVWAMEYMRSEIESVGYSQEKIGDYEYKKFKASDARIVLTNMLNDPTRKVVA